MKTSFLFFLLLSAEFVFGSCNYCDNLEEAKRAPLEVKTLVLTNQNLPLVPEDFNTFANLEILRLNHCNVLEISPALLLPSVRVLDLSHNQFNGWKFDVISKVFPNLQVLDLSYNEISFFGTQTSGLKTLTELNLSHNNFLCIPYEIQAFNRLKKLDLSNNRLQTGLESIGYLWQLESLKINENKTLPPGDLFHSLTAMEYLIYLETDGDLIALKDCNILVKLPVQHLSIHGISSKSSLRIEKATSLRKITFNNISAWNEKNHVQLPRSTKSVVLINSVIPAPHFWNIKDTLSIVGSLNLNVLTAYRRLRVLDLTSVELSDDGLNLLKAALPQTIILNHHLESGMSQAMSGNTVSSIRSPEVHIVILKGNKEHLIREKNLSLEIPAGAFLSPDNSVYQDQVKVTTKVYGNALEMALDGAPMIFHRADTNLLFSSNGMFAFKAVDKQGQLLQPNPENPILVIINNLQPDRPGGLYTFDNTNKQWQTLQPVLNHSDRELRIKQITDSIDSLDLTKRVIVRKTESQVSITMHISQSYKNTLNINMIPVPIIQKTPSSPSFLNQNTHQTALMNNYTWYLDTILNKEQTNHLDSLFKINHSIVNTFRKEYFSPKSIHHFHLIEDPAHDNYRMLFQFKDSMYNLPVSLQEASNKKIQKITAEFEIENAVAKRKDERNEEKFDQQLTTYKSRLVSQLRQELLQLALDTNRQVSLISSSPNQLQFGLTNFGLINCDYFLKFPPECSYTFSPNLSDQNGNPIEIPQTFRVVNPNYCSYQEQNYLAEQVYSGMSNSIFIVEIDAKHLAIARNGTEPYTVISKMTILDIEGKSAEEIAQLIFNNG